MSVRVEGMPKLRAALLRVTGEAEKTTSREVVRSALNVQAEARQRAPIKHGRLRNSIAVAEQEPATVAASDQATETKKAPNATRPGMLNAVIGTNVAYGKRIEFGFSGTDALGRSYNQPAQPYLFPALEEERGAFLSRLRRELGAAFVRAAR